ncbi:MAG: hypothetical protein ABSB70_08480 [Candidatus Velthaea sp.]|jgi:hypothetical protein
MTMNSHKVQRLAVAAALVAGIVSTGVDAFAQTAATPQTPAATNVSMSTTSDWKAARQATFEQENADARRAAFYKLGTDL